MMFLMLLADACCQRQYAHIGIEVLSDALVAVEQAGLRFHVAELHRLRGVLSLQQETPDEGLAETCFQHALEIAQHQQAQSWALRAAVSSSQLWRQQGKSRAAHALLANVYNRFTEGVDTPDLQEAQALLESLT